MKKLCLTILSLIICLNFSFSQTNTYPFPSSGNVGIGTTSPGNTLGFQNVDVDPGNSGITWYNPTPLDYGIYRTPGTWAGPNYQQLKLSWQTGILLNPGSGYGKSYVEVTGGGLRVTSGNVGIGTTSPVSPLDVNGAIAVRGSVINETQYISAPADGTYVIASGIRIRGTYTISFESANREQTVVLQANATRYYYGSTLSVLSNTSYAGSVVMSNFRYLFNSDNSVIYLVFDVSNRNGGTSITAHFDGNGAYGPSWGGTIPGSATAAGVYPFTVNMGNVGINTTDTKGYTLAVNGSVIAVSVNIKPNANWPDYVFKPTYQLLSLADVKTYIDKNRHLPEMPSAADVAKDGINVGQMNTLLTKKVEELTLYLLEKDKQLKEQGEQLKEQEKINQSFQQQLNNLTQQVKALKPAEAKTN